MSSRVRLGAVTLVVAAMLLVACGDGADADRAASTRTSATGSCPSDPAPVRDVAYASVPGVDPSLLSLDVYPPTHGCPAPVVVWVHGGGWQVGDKRNQMADKVRLWRDAGYGVVSVNYRLTDPSAPAPVQYPTHDEDVAAAIAWVHGHVARFGGDPGRIAVLGHSAGAQIVATVATDARFLGAHGLGLDALRCAGALDTEGYDVAAPAGAGVELYREAFGDDPATWAEASPNTHVAPGTGIPHFLVVERGTPRRRRQADSFVTRLRAAAVPVTVVDAAPLSHAEVNSSIGRPGDTVMTPPLAAFLAECFS
jgi:acetyl esterase/lipase